MADTDEAPAPPTAAELRRRAEERAARVVAGVNRFYIGPRLHYLWTEKVDGEAKMMQWHPETPDEFAESALFYDAAHGLGEFARSVRPGEPHPRSADELGLIAAVAANRDDDLPYLVYADYLSERGDSQGDFIRASVRRYRTPENDPARAALDETCGEMTAAHAEEWFQPLTDMGLRPEIRGMGLAGVFQPWLWLGPRGVIDSITIDRPGLLPGAADRLFAAAPLLRTLRFDFGHLDIAGLAGVEQLAQIDDLDLRHTALAAEGLATLVESRHLGRLRSLGLSTNSIGDDGLTALVGSPVFDGLTSLDIGQCGVTAAGLRALANAPAARGLRTLCVGSNPLEAAGVRALCEARYLTGLTRLSLRGVELDDASRAALNERFGEGVVSQD